MANVTCITKISTVKSLNGLSSSIRYCCNGSPHNSDYGNIKHRAFVVRGWNCNDEPSLAYKDMKTVLNNNYINHMNITCIRSIESFKGFNYLDPSDRRKALELDEQFIRKKFPHNQVLIVGHMDGQNHHIHFHNLVCARRFDNGKSVANDASWFKTAPVMDNVLKENGYHPLNRGHLKRASINRSRGAFYHYNHDNSYIIWLSSKIFQAKKDAKTLSEFNEHLKQNGINVEMFKMTKTKNGRKLKKYDKPGGNYKQLANGKYIRYRKHFSYSFNWHGKRVVIREKKLGRLYCKSAIMSKIKDNRSVKRASIQYKPHLKHSAHIVNSPHHHPTYHHRKSLSSSVKHWNFKETMNEKQLQAIMRKADEDSDSDDFSDLASYNDIDPNFNGLTK